MRVNEWPDAGRARDHRDGGSPRTCGTSSRRSVPRRRSDFRSRYRRTSRRRAGRQCVRRCVNSSTGWAQRRHLRRQLSGQYQLPDDRKRSERRSRPRRLHGRPVPGYKLGLGWLLAGWGGGGHAGWGAAGRQHHRTDRLGAAAGTRSGQQDRRRSGIWKPLRALRRPAIDDRTFRGTNHRPVQPQ